MHTPSHRHHGFAPRFFARFLATVHAARIAAALAIAVIAATFVVHDVRAQAPTLTGTWTARGLAGTSGGQPAGRGWIDLIYDPVAGRPVLFGGSGGTYRNDILQIDFAGSRWVEIEPYAASVLPSGPPCPRDEHAVEYDSYNGFYWSFGGSGYACDTRTSTVGTGSAGAVIHDPTLTQTTPNYYLDWLVTVLAGPGPFYAYVTAYDPIAKTLTLDRSFSGNPVGLTYSVRPQGGGGTWYYDPVTGTWHSFEDPSGGYTGDRPLSRLSPAFAYSAADDLMVMFGGMIYNDTWLLDAQTRSWLLARGDGWPGNPPRRSQITNAMAYDSTNGVFVLFGGTCGDGSGCGVVPYNGRLADTWIYRVSTNTWTQVTPAASPPARQQHTMSYDPLQGVVVLYGGIGNGGPFGDVWTYHVPTNTWRQVSVNTGPVARRIHAMVYDPTLGEHVVYGGVQASGASLWDTWSLRLALQGTNLAPTASFTVSPSSGTVGTNFAFNGSASIDPDGTIVSYAWQFGDGTTGSGVTANHQYGSPGTFTVTLTVTDNGGLIGSNSAQVAVNPSGTGLVNGGFETPTLAAASYQYRPTGGTWTFGPGTGIQRNGSAWGAPNAPEGQQTAFLQGAGATLSQVINLDAGTYTVSFAAARRAWAGAGQPLQLTVDGVAVGSPILPTSTTFATYTTASFAVTTGAHTLAFVTSNPVGDNSSFLDSVVVNSTAGQAPAFTSASSATFTVGLAGTLTVTATGVPTPTLSASGTLPSGVTFVDNGNGTATLSGTPATGTGGTYPLTLTAANGVGSNAVMSFMLVVNASPPVFANSGFETPALAAASYQYQPAGGTWTFGPGTGLQRNGSAWGAPSAPQGQQTAFLQGTGATLSQVVNLPAGTYTVSFFAARRAWQGAGQPLQLMIDGAAVGSPILPASTAFATYTTAPFTVAAGNHTLAFTTSNPVGDNSSLLDNVTFNVAGP